MKITRIQQRPRGDRVRIFVDHDDAYRLEIAADLLLRAGLAAGDDITDARLAALEADDQAYRAREAALSLLAHRARSRVEIRRRLQRKDFAGPVIEEVVAWLEERDYLDDTAFAESFVRDRLRLRPRGRLGLIQELRRKGVADGVAEGAIQRVMDAEKMSEKDLARAAADAWARKNRSALRKAARSKEGRLEARRRLYGHLARRGFAGDAVRAAIAAVLDD